MTFLPRIVRIFSLIVSAGNIRCPFLLDGMVSFDLQSAQLEITICDLRVFILWPAKDKAPCSKQALSREHRARSKSHKSTTSHPPPPKATEDRRSVEMGAASRLTGLL
jgi:hypothetical protein